jgi:Xaa-Pro aminopeptidase
MQEERKEMISRIFDHHGIGTLIFWRPDELVLTTGYLPNWGVSFLVCTRDGDATLFVPELEPEDILPPGISVIRFPWGMLDCPDPWQELYDKITLILFSKGLRHLPVSFIRQMGGTAPCMMAGEQPPLPPDLIERLAEVSAAGFKDVTTDLLALYTFKTTADVTALGIPHRVASLAVDVFYAQVRMKRQTEVAIAAAIESAVHNTTGLNGVRYARAWAMVQSGVNTQYGGRYNRSSGKALADGEMVMLEMSVCVNGYWADITRTATTTEPSSQQKKIVRTIAEAQQLVISRMKPGVRMNYLDELAREHIGKAGFGRLFNHALGHQVGFRYHDPGPGLSPNCTAVLQEGMVLTVEPGIYGEAIGCGARIEDNILVTADGCKILSDYLESA